MNWLDVLTDQRILHEEHGEWICCRCPFCNDNSMHLGYHQTNGYFNCWRCGYHAIHEVRNIVGVQFTGTKRIVEKKQKHIVSAKLPNNLILTKQHTRYLKSRGINKATAELYGITGTSLWSYTPNGKHVPFFVLFPVISNNRTVSYVMRNTRESEYRYMVCPKEAEAIPAKHCLYGEHLHLHTHSVIVTEGIFDSIRFGVGAISLLGVAFTRSQVAKLSKYDNVYLMLDNDKAGAIARDRLKDELSPLTNVYVIEYEGKDASEASEQDIRDIKMEVFI